MLSLKYKNRSRKSKYGNLIKGEKMETCKHIIAFDFAYSEVIPPVAITDDQPESLAERTYCGFCPNCGAKLREPDSNSRIYGLRQFEFMFKPPDAGDKGRFDIRLFRFCINTGQLNNGNADKIYL